MMLTAQARRSTGERNESYSVCNMRHFFLICIDEFPCLHRHDRSMMTVRAHHYCRLRTPAQTTVDLLPLATAKRSYLPGFGVHLNASSRYRKPVRWRTRQPRFESTSRLCEKNSVEDHFMMKNFTFLVVLFVVIALPCLTILSSFY